LRKLPMEVIFNIIKLWNLTIKIFNILNKRLIYPEDI
jgi:hypothetical protein